MDCSETPHFGDSEQTTKDRANCLIVDRTQFGRFYDVLFRYTEYGTIISLRVFDQFDRGKPPILIMPVPVTSDREGVLTLIETAAQVAAEHPVPAVFAPPVCTFQPGDGIPPWKAREQDVDYGVSLSVEVDDSDPEVAVTRLTAILGLPTVVMSSGSVWTDPATGELKPKLHAHWRLSEPTNKAVDHARLKHARQLATGLIGGDPTAGPVSHPLRWPGSWNRKSTPVMARMVVINDDAEIHLDEAIERLAEATEAAGWQESPFERKTGSGPPEAPLALVASAMEAIHNEDAHYNEWIRLGYACYHATGGSAEGFEIWSRWSTKSKKHDAGETEAAWNRIVAANQGAAPPVRCGAGTIFWIASRLHGWRRPQPEPPPDTDDPGYYESAERARATQASTKGTTLDGYDLTEDGIALAFVAANQDLLRYDHDRGAWFQWTGLAWRRDQTRLAFAWARNTCRKLAKEAGLQDKALATFAKAATAAAVERFAQADQALAVTSKIWDRDLLLLGTPGGTLDLRTGHLRSPVPEDFISKLCAVAPADTADCPTWFKFLEQVTGGDATFIRFLQQWCGYCLTGDISEQALVFAYGPGGNGKGVFLNTISKIFGDYACNAAMDTFTASAGDRHPTDLAMLQGARLVTASETEEGRDWAEARIKAMTGADTITARFMRQDFFEYVPQFKLTIIGNHKPSLRNVDDAARRRFNLAPFLYRPPVKDLRLEAKLREEWPGILRWMVDGCLDWQQNGLTRPDVVAAATAEYFAEQDIINRWIEERCDQGPTLSDTQRSLFKSWGEYAVANGERPGTAKWFTQTLAKLDHVAVKNTPGFHGQRGFKGIAVRLTKPADYTQSRGADDNEGEMPF